jgi:hypothetical protein
LSESEDEERCEEEDASLVNTTLNAGISEMATSGLHSVDADAASLSNDTEGMTKQAFRR